MRRTKMAIGGVYEKDGGHCLNGESYILLEEIVGTVKNRAIFPKLPFFSLFQQPGKERQTKPKGLSSVLSCVHFKPETCFTL